MRNDREKFRTWSAKEQFKYKAWIASNAGRPKRGGRYNLPPVWRTAVRIALILTFKKGAAGVGGGSHNDHLKKLLYEYHPEIYPKYTLPWTSHVASALREIRKNHDTFGSVPHMSRRKQTNSGYRSRRAFLLLKDNGSLSYGQQNNLHEGVTASSRSMMAMNDTLVKVYDDLISREDLPPALRIALGEARTASELQIEALIKVLESIQSLAA